MQLRVRRWSTHIRKCSFPSSQLKESWNTAVTSLAHQMFYFLCSQLLNFILPLSICSVGWGCLFVFPWEHWGRRRCSGLATPQARASCRVPRALVTQPSQATAGIAHISSAALLRIFSNERVMTCLPTVSLGAQYHVFHPESLPSCQHWVWSSVRSYTFAKWLDIFL